jgi:sensor histidine kinase regulating citrate/malate metabolism
MICLSIICLLSFFILTLLSIHNQSEINHIILQTRLHDDETRINDLLQWNASVRTLRHDLNNHLIAIKRHIIDQDYKKSLDYIERIEESISEIPQLSSTNNSTLNAILDVKRMICHNEHIDLKCYLQNDLPEFDTFSFSTIFGNLMDNAIEAEKKEEQKEIRIAIVSENGFIRITIQNRVQQNVLVNGQLPSTSKNNKESHGLGMLSVAETISKVNGVIDIYEKGGWFIVDVLMQQSSNVLL